MLSLSNYFSVVSTVIGLSSADAPPYIDFIESADFSKVASQVDLSPDQNDRASLLYASSQTRNMLGPLAERITNWTGQIPVAVISASDFTSLQLDPDEPDIDGIRDHIRSLIADTDLSVDLISDAIIGQMSEKMAEDTGANSTIKGLSSIDDSQAEFCVLVAETPSLSGHNVMHEISGMPIDIIEEVPGTSEEWFAAIMRHEAAHCTQLVDHDRTALDWDEILLNEVDADQQMFDGHLEELNNPVFPVTANVPELLVLSRSIATFNGTTAITHKTSGGIVLNNEDIQNRTKLTTDYMGEVGDIERSLNIRMAELYGSNEDWLTGVKSTLKLFEHAENLGDKPEFADLAAASSKFNNEFSEEEATGILEAGGTYKELYEAFPDHPQFLEFSASFVGNGLGNPESRMFYEQSYHAAETLIADGTYMDGSLGHKMMSQYKTALETFVPSIKEVESLDLLHPKMEVTHP